MGLHKHHSFFTENEWWRRDTSVHGIDGMKTRHPSLWVNDTEASHPSMGQMGIEATPPSLEMTGTVTIDNIFRHNCNCDNHMRAVTTSSIKAEHKPPPHLISGQFKPRVFHIRPYCHLYHCFVGKNSQHTMYSRDYGMLVLFSMWVLSTHTNR